MLLLIPRLADGEDHALEKVAADAKMTTALLDRLTHHADVTLIEGTSYRVRESELEAAAHKKNSERSPRAQRS